MKSEDAGYYMRKPFTADDIRLLLDSFNTSRISGLRNFAIINLMARTGIREIEVHRANRGDIKDTDSDIQSNNGKILFYIQRKGKRAKEDFVILTKETYAAINEYLMWRNPIEASDPLFISHGNKKRGERLGIRTIQDMIYEQLKTTGLKKECLSGHSIRHFFATQLIEKNVNIEKIRIALGHKSIVTTSRYTKGIDRLSNPVEEQIEI
ncbi:MAG: tyrosine-type recombinase/integrase [Candidatus Kuenenia sp.]|nr:tyrosine-type recombinase/integrase [Candidatus Kuenenia sp.]